ncbi:hypothetical protein LZ554_006891 [Drepanopeziza brunnea f. sp. 'monogermtubi']|nr:hypothetical protein LZ554_006891 [Drepanopeziza brunnea f. sp. 'monogermtubi']
MATHPPSGGADESQLDQKIDEQSDTLVAETKELAEEMHQRCRVLLDELLQFQAHLKALKKEARVEVRCFKGGVQSELRILGKLLKSDPANPKTAHGLRSSNLSFYWLVWSIAKTCRSVIGLEKKFFKIHAKADIISEDGLSWTMVSSVTEKKIIWDLAKAGWVDSSGESEDDFELLEDDKPEGLLRQVEALLKASRATVVHGRHPKITLVLPKIKAIPDSKEVGAILQKIRNMGVAILTSQELPTGPPLPADAIEQMAADRLNCFSDTLNIDCTILLAFASDLSHGRVEPAQWHNRAIARQIELEAEDLLLPSSLWPACGSRKLVTTREAADRMREIIKTIGSEDESKRASLLLGLDENSHLPQEQLVKHFQTLTDYPVPAEWSLPIKIIDTDMAAITSSLPAFAENVAEKLTPINRSVFFYGWANRMTILSSNAGVAKVFDHAVEQSSDPDSAGPDIWLSPTCRSLVGKEKKRRGFTEREEGTL